MNESHSRFPLAYLITFRSYGTWLHGDERGSVDRHRNRHGAPRIPRNAPWNGVNERTLKHPPAALDAARRRAVKAAIHETCDLREWELQALNVRTNHVHAVVSARCKPERVLSALKANATRSMREAGCWANEHSPWSAGGSRRYLWTLPSVQNAIAYVVAGQGEPLPD